MADKPTLRRALVLLIVGALLLPIVAWAIVAISALLGAMGDPDGAVWANRCAAACGAVWLVDLICLIVAQAINSLTDADPRE